MKNREQEFNVVVELVNQGLPIGEEDVLSMINYIHSLQSKIAMLELDSITTNSYRRVKEGS